MVEKWTFVFWFSYALVTFSPLLFLWIAGVSISRSIEPSVLGSFVTASGIFAGFITSSAISRRESLQRHHYAMLFVNLGVFFYILNMIFVRHLIYLGTVDLFDFALVLVSVNANGFTAIIIAQRLTAHKIVEDIHP